MRYVVLGASASAINGVKELRKNDSSAEIILVSKDDKIYSRCILHHYLTGHRTVEQLSFAGADFENKYDVKWIKNQNVVGISTDDKYVVLENDDKVAFDKLLIATGARPNFPPIENICDFGNIHGFRNFDDVVQIKEKCKKAKNIVVLGGGLVGMDVTEGLCYSGVGKFTVVEFADRLLNRQLDKKAASKYVEAFEKKGVEFIFNNAIKSVSGDENGNVKSVTLTNDTVLPCDLLIVTIGVKSTTDFLVGSKVQLDNFGVLTSNQGLTSVEDIYAAGDVTGRGPIWPVAVKEGIIAAKNMTDKNAKMDDFFYSKSTMNFCGINTMSIGDIENIEGCEVQGFSKDNVYKKIITKDNIIVGALLQGDLSYGGILTRLISKKIDISKVNKSVFKIDYSDFFHIDNNAEYYYNE